MKTIRDLIAAALLEHSYTNYDYGYHCICGHTEASQAGMVGHIADRILAAIKSALAGLASAAPSPTPARPSDTERGN